MINGAIFDADGTLLDSMYIWDRAGAIYLNSMGIEAETDLGTIMFPMTMLEGALYLKDTYGLVQDINQIQEDINRTVEDFYINDVKFKPGVEEFIDTLHSHGIPMTVATSSDQPIIMTALKRLNVLDCFADILTCSSIGIGKDHPDIYLEACQVMNSRPERTIVFEDALHAAATAKKAGFMVVGVYDSTSEAHQREIIDLSDYYIRDFSTDGKAVLDELL